MKKTSTRIVTLILAIVLVLSVLPMNAFASQAQYTAPTAPITVDKNLITCAAHAAAYVTPEILGVTNTTARQSEFASDFYSGNYPGAQKFAMLGIFGTDANENPNPYHYNYFYNCYAKSVGKDAVSSNYSLTCNSATKGPNSEDITPITVNGENISASLYYRPDILLGATVAEDGTTGYTSLLAELTENKDADRTNDYAPYVIPFEMSSTYTFLKSLYAMADACNEIMEKDSTKKTRYKDDPVVIAENVEKFSKGLSAYITKSLADNKAQKKVVACVDRSATNTYRNSLAGATDAEKQNYFVINTAKDSTQPTTNTSRGCEFLADTTTNIYDVLGSSEVKDAKIMVSAGPSGGMKEVTCHVVTAEQIAKYADAVICVENYQSFSARDNAEALINELELHAGAYADKAAKMDVLAIPYDPVESVGANSVENVFCVAYYNAFCYPEYLNQFDVATYWYKNFYHVTDASKLQSIMSVNFRDSSVPNAYKGVYTTNISSYNEREVENCIVAGMKYYEANKASFEGTLLYQNGRTDKVDNGWVINWTRGIGSDNKTTDVNVVNGTNSTITATIPESAKTTIENAVISNFTDEEKQQYDMGDSLTVNVEVTPVDEKDIDKDTLAKITDAAKIDAATVGAYLEIDISYVLGSNNAVAVKDLGNDEIEITINLPESLQGKGTYIVYREHDGKVSTIVPKVSSDGKSLTFKSSKFSTYAIAYTEKIADTSDETAVFAVTVSTVVAAVGAAYVGKARRKIGK